MAEFTSRVVKRTAIGFHPTVLPTVYDDALSYYEELNKILHSLNDAIEVIDENRVLILQLDANVKELDARLTAQIKQVADDLATLRKEYEGFRDEVKAKIAAIEAKDREQDNRLNSIETKNNQQDARLTAIETKNTQQDGEINALKARCATLESDLSKLTARVTTLENNLSKLTTRVSTAETFITELQDDIERIDHEQTEQNNRIKALEDAPGGGGVGSIWGTVEVYQLWNNDAENGSLTNTHFVRHVDLQNNKYNVLLNTGNCKSAVPLATLFAHKEFTVVGQPQIDELIITSWDPNVCDAEAITTIKQQYTIKHAWIPSAINWTNYTGSDKETVKSVEAAVIKALNENGTTEFTRMGDNGQNINVGAIIFNCLYDPTMYGINSTNMVCRVHCNCDMIVPGMADITNVAKNNKSVRNWLPNMRVIDAPSENLVEPLYNLDVASKNILTHISYNQKGVAPASYSANYGGIQWYNTAGGENARGFSSVINLSGDMPVLDVSNNTSYVPELNVNPTLCHTPVKGVDYWTEADKSEIVSDLLAALPDGTEVSY